MITNTALLLHFLEVFFTDWFVLEEEVLPSEWIITDVALHTFRMIECVIVHHAVSHDLEFTNTTLFLSFLIALGTICLFILGKEFPIQFFLAICAAEALFMEDLSKCRASIIC